MLKFQRVLLGSILSLIFLIPAAYASTDASPAVRDLDYSTLDIAHTENDIIVLQWNQKQRQEEKIFLNQSLDFLRACGVRLNKDELYYFNLLKERTHIDPNIAYFSLTRALAITLYQEEPKTRAALEKIFIKVPKANP